MHVLKDCKIKLIVRGRTVSASSQNGCCITSLDCNGQSLEEIHGRVLLTGSLPEAIAKVP